MLNPFDRSQRSRGSAQEFQRPVSSNTNGDRCTFEGRGAASKLVLGQANPSQFCDFPGRRIRTTVRLACLLWLQRLLAFAGFCGIAFGVGAGVALYLENAQFWTTEAAAAIADKPQVVNRSGKGDRISASMDSSKRPVGPQAGFGMLEVSGPLGVAIRIKDAYGRLVFEMDPLRRITLISKREVRGAPSSKEGGGQKSPKSRDVPVECDAPGSRPVGSPLVQFVEECHLPVQRDAGQPASLL